MEKKPFYNCHTHTFTIDHVPNRFGKKLLPFLYKIITIRVIKWYYLHFTMKNEQCRKMVHTLNKIRYAFIDFLKWTVVLQWLNVLVCFIFRWIFGIIIHLVRVDFIFSRTTREAIRRFKSLGRYSLYCKQYKIFDLLVKTYEPDTRFVVLAMDMDYMDAGKPKISYLEQLDDLRNLKKNHPETLLPFLFLDPRRIAETRFLKGHQNYEIYSKHLLQSGDFDGIKLYPALGYYPFDKELISMYLFAQENAIPIMTHCVAGTVYYRGKKKEEWNAHPILKYPKRKDRHAYIPLPQTGNVDFTTNFTHPLNYHCLLNKELLSEYLGYEADLSQLKICIAHFGGDDQWERYMQDSWNNYNKMINHEEREAYLKRKRPLNHGNQRTIWWNASWLSVIYDLMVTYENVYADISYVLFNEKMYPLLKFILQDPKVKHRVLFGTDYYMVSQKNTEKELYHNLRGYLGESLFELISYHNPKTYLSTKWKVY